MRVLVTGSSGLLGGQVMRDLKARGDEPVPFDRAEGCDIGDLEALNEACKGCDAVVHSAAMLGKPGEDPTQIFQVNVLGTWNVLSAAKTQGVSRFVYISSVNAFGVFQGQRKPDYLPIDDDHKEYPFDAYGISKHLGEEMCRDIARINPMSAVALRPPWICPADAYATMVPEQRDPAREHYHNWEYGAFIDVRDMAQACLAALVCDVAEFDSMLVCAPDVRTPGATAKEMVDHVWPGIDWRGGAAFEREPYRGLVDCSKAARVIGFKPEYSWARAVEEFSGEKN